MHQALCTFAQRLKPWLKAAPATPPHNRANAANPRLDDHTFNQLALELFLLQFEHVPPYRRFCQARNASPGQLDHWTQVPCVPTRAFKELELTALNPCEIARVFHSSGTSSQIPGRHFHSTQSLELYEASLLPWFTQHLLPDAKPVRLISLTPSAADAPRSSLAYMLDTVARHAPVRSVTFLGQVAEDHTWLLDPAAAAKQIREADDLPLLITGTTLAWNQLIDHLRACQKTLPLPEGSRLMETGGPKGRSSAVAPETLHHALLQTFKLPPSNLVSEYGMCELNSQAYNQVAGSTPTHSNVNCFRFPPWARAVTLDPESGRPAPFNTPGPLAIFDLANVASVMAILTDDIARTHPEGFSLHGRAQAAEPRGCSLLQT